MTGEATGGADGILRSACISADEQYRYRLDRTWDLELGKVLFVMLNPSRANGLKDDHTITKCIRFTAGGHDDALPTFLEVLDRKPRIAATGASIGYVRRPGCPRARPGRPSSTTGCPWRSDSNWITWPRAAS